MQTYEAETRRAYERVGERYDRQTGRFKDRIAYPALVERLAEELGSLAGKHVLDAGCGSGELVALLGRKRARAQGVDLSPSAVARGERRGLELVEGSLRALPFPSASFDAVVSFHALNYVPYEEQLGALIEQHRVLKAGGIFLAACFFSPGERGSELALPMLGETFRLYPQTGPVLEALLLEAGFRRARAAPLTCRTKTLDELAHTASAEEQSFLELVRTRPYALLAFACK